MESLQVDSKMCLTRSCCYLMFIITCLCSALILAAETENNNHTSVDIVTLNDAQSTEMLNKSIDNTTAPVILTTPTTTIGASTKPVSSSSVSITVSSTVVKPIVTNIPPTLNSTIAAIVSTGDFETKYSTTATTGTETTVNNTPLPPAQGDVTSTNKRDGEEVTTVRSPMMGVNDTTGNGTLSGSSTTPHNRLQLKQRIMLGAIAAVVAIMAIALGKFGCKKLEKRMTRSEDEEYNYILEDAFSMATTEENVWDARWSARRPNGGDHAHIDSNLDTNRKGLSEETSLRVEDHQRVSLHVPSSGVYGATESLITDNGPQIT